VQEHEAGAEVQQVERARLALAQQRQGLLQVAVRASLLQEEGAQHEHQRPGRQAQPLRLPVALGQRALALLRQRRLVAQAHQLEFALGVLQARVEVVRGLGAVAGLDLGVDGEEARGHLAARLAARDLQLQQVAQHAHFVALERERAEAAVGGFQLARGAGVVAAVERGQPSTSCAIPDNWGVLQARRSASTCSRRAPARRCRRTRAPCARRRTAAPRSAWIVEAAGEDLRALQADVGSCVRPSCVCARARLRSRRTRIGMAWSGRSTARPRWRIPPTARACRARCSSEE
jgi:hypothetical protein